jgi:cytochrome c-type biogenesis protein CcmE
MKPAYMIAIVILVASAAITLFTFTGSLAKHVTIGQVMKMPGQMVQVPGRILKDTVNFTTAKGELKFDIESMQKGDNGRLTVVYGQPKPENFDTATQVEAVGVYKDGVFRASNLLVKCPSKYNDEKGSGAKKAY